ncbi:MAG: histidine phosphatase family protein [Silicimonas sp.]|nr:histidine phosphatase family protein [Silicimonas sp.]NND20842.1 histidine phosphatase family protein [Silicimonas sp.]NNF91478.1 histidine phosphatase family protein [Boseongicola sp.]NNL72503.1 histidine phosphatase family protein [Silicimonas sp.]RZW12431.1 MAG: histidine phosphatase family protein [Paracoccaceae bacterium]
MPLTLILTRHAKSAWDDPALDDFERPLNGRGRSSAAKLGHWLARKGYLPDTVLVSGARRTVETWSVMSEALPETATMESVPALYLSTSNVMMNVLKARKSPVIMLIAHNPGIADFAERLVTQPPDHDKFQQYPTGATTIISFDAPDWSAVGWGTGEVLDFVVPREI